MHLKVGFVGLGRMGEAIAGRLLAAGNDLMVYNRSPGKAAELVKNGARQATTLREAVQHGAVTMSMLADDAALAATCNGPDGLIASLPEHGIHVVMGTHDVDVIRALAKEHETIGRTLIAAPVLGRPQAVIAGRLAIIAGGASAALTTVRPLLDAIGRKVFFAGTDPGAASAMKLANNFLLGCAIEALGEAFSLVQKSGVDSSTFHEMIVDGLFSCPAYTTYAKIIADRSWDTVGFTVELALKDINLALAAGALAGVPLPSADVCRDRLLGAVSHGDAERDWAAVAREQARASGLEIL